MTEQTKKTKPILWVLLSHYLEMDIPQWEKVTHKKIGDNLRCYPIIAAFAVAIIYLWDTPYVVLGAQTPVAKIAAVVWGIWLTFYSFLTVFQTAWIFSSSYPDLLHVIGDSAKKVSLRTKLIVGVVSAIAAGFFLIGAVYLACLIFSHAAKF